ncbi:MAG TPA: DUF3089 domain-containing protein [Puia sp.]|nr:DUF3089 domain-containing protein [Puia sp.]
MQRNPGLVLMVIISSFFSCSPKYISHLEDYRFKTKLDEPDYSSLEYWAAHPYKKSLSDSLPSLIRNNFVKDSSVDVFFLHPTTFDDMKDHRWNADINDDTINAKTDYSTILYQASAFNECRVFAPRYRQANLRAYYTKDTIHALAAFNLAYQDLKNAFQYYLEHYNEGRPIIIVSHSQGTTHAQKLLKEFFDEKPLQKKLIAAYLIGMFIPENEFKNLPQCNDSLQTGCFIGWRSFKYGYEPGFVKEETKKCYVTNPLTWTNTDTYASRDKNLGAVVTNFDKVIRSAADAQIHENVLWLHRPHFPGSFLYRSRNYHIGDINLFYVNIRQNLHVRIASFRAKN